MMEDMDVDQIIDIPDTPDRPAVRRINAGDCMGRESKSLIAGHLRSSDFIDEGCLNQPRARGQPVGENRHSRNRCTTIASSPLENSNASRNVSLFRRTVIDKNPKLETRNSTGAQHVDKGKLACSRFPSISSSFCEENARVDLAEHNGNERKLEMAFPRGKSKDLPAKELKEGQLAGRCGSSLHWPPKFPKTSSNSNKGKEKIGENAIKGTDSIMGHGKEINLSVGSQRNNEKQMSAFHQAALSPRFNGHKRLVRNGCISPHNIQIKAKQLAEHSQNCTKGAEEDPGRDIVSNGSCMVDIRDIVAEDNTSDRSKAIMTHPSNFKERHPTSISLSGSSAMSSEVSGNSQADGDSFEGLGGWRSTRNQSKKADHSLCGATELNSIRDVEFLRVKGQSRDNLSGENCGMEDQNVSQTVSKLVLEPGQISEPRCVANTLNKRQRNHESTIRKHGESSWTAPDEDIVFLGSSGESSSSRSCRIQSQQQQGILDVDEFIELSPKMRCSNSRGIGGTDNDESDAKARQLEADEMLARELQEQLYHDSPVFGGDEIDENIAWMLQQEENALPFSYQNHHVSHPRTTSMHSYRQPQSRLLQNSLNRRGVRSRVHTSSGVTQLRSRFLNRSRAAPSRARNLLFPLGMDLDMRIDILEALEAAAGDLSDVGTARHISQLQRDFNENDYEMLLALDDNNNQHGASDSQINSLPLSTVQTDNFEEVCAVCLDTPAIGETIRHLPCMHKFHKACIDPWLSRRTILPSLQVIYNLIGTGTY